MGSNIKIWELIRLDASDVTQNILVYQNIGSHLYSHDDLPIFSTLTPSSLFSN